MFGAKSVFILSYEFSKCDMVHNSYTVIHDVYRTKEEANRMIESLKLQLEKQIPVTYHIKHCILNNLEPENKVEKDCDTCEYLMNNKDDNKFLICKLHPGDQYELVHEMNTLVDELKKEVNMYNIEDLFDAFKIYSHESRIEELIKYIKSRK